MENTVTKLGKHSTCSFERNDLVIQFGENPTILIQDKLYFKDGVFSASKFSIYTNNGLSKEISYTTNEIELVTNAPEFFSNCTTVLEFDVSRSFGTYGRPFTVSWVEYGIQNEEITEILNQATNMNSLQVSIPKPKSLQLSFKVMNSISFLSFYPPPFF